MKKNIAIIGAGVSGLTTAIHLESLGYQPTIFEASSTLGGRVQSDVLENYTLDRGFQVLLTAYPMVQKYLDLEKLDCTILEPGSYVFKNQKARLIGDPLRKASFLVPTLVSGIGNLGDKLKIFKLNNLLKKKSIEAIFQAPETSTLTYLQNFGFSTEIIEDFFRPFFGGIFLETELATSSRKFEFIFKMFGEGQAAIPKAGIGAVANQLAGQLKQTRILYNKEVKTVTGQEILFENGEQQNFDFIVIANDATSGIIPNMANYPIRWKGTQTLYFEVATQKIDLPILALQAYQEKNYVNSIYYPEVSSTAEKKLLSVSVVKDHSLSEYELIQVVRQELTNHFDIETLRFLKCYHIPKALPKLENIQYSINYTETKLTEHLFLAGDTLLNGSLNAAMLSGELAAEAIHESITGNKF